MAPLKQAGRKQSSDIPVIRQLDEATSNRIAAGEVVERPASAVKELVENALDAGASRISISYSNGGKTLIRVVDNGHGIPADQLTLALSRHATSKTDGADLLNIQSFGFRGEALPSLGAVGRLKIASHALGADEGASIAVNGGQLGAVMPAALGQGTHVELKDLFFATPARLKFMRSDRAESMAILDAIKRLAMAEPFVSFKLTQLNDEGKGREIFRVDAQSGDLFTALSTRLQKILGKEFTQNCLAVDATREDISLTGFASLPTYSRGAAVAQYLFVNGRPVRDRLLNGALRGAYSDFLHRNRHPVCALFIESPPALVDVNVHPGKTEVRFRDPGIVRGLIISALKHALAEAGHRTSNTVAGQTLGAFRPDANPEDHKMAPRYQMEPRANHARLPPTAYPQAHFNEETAMYSGRVETALPESVDAALNRPLGAARAQIHQNYIIAQTPDSMIIVDQHAAHERLVYEKLKTALAQNGVASQALLIPDVVELSEQDAARFLDVASDLALFGLQIEAFGGNAICVRATPAILGEVNVKTLIADICDELTQDDQTLTVQSRVEAILSRMACHGSIRSGRIMRAEEMNAVLREMEATPHSGQCNHGRPTYVELKLHDIEKLFGRR